MTRQVLLLLVCLHVLLLGIVPRGDMQEFARAATAWQQHHAATHPEEGFIVFLYDHLVAHSHDDASGAHHALGLHPGPCAVVAIVAPAFVMPARQPVQVRDEADVALAGHPVEPARQGMGASLWRPPQVA